ncbi:CDP-diacylglycerol--serine O-phosphatidyltransferase [Alicyclobacillus cellulosilyticus]|uniref:CDP-diacylglycerol--serine O-phosphatidyltransferase n=1 Tax=Alicyclobacillus cellulosilyticus TaxID=1003997 RepID=A0A917K7S7_9BACL|nr:CDP-diacylglycerol--serine O-phosphatidyltransferase [Alicyclobacillus cellulosilyticus]GGJ01280.1 CDP-diacylglycerol--serine O-phosphatidyltransferase [Alicyclobacillus cellulosilyticus]
MSEPGLHRSGWRYARRWLPSALTVFNLVLGFIALLISTYAPADAALLVVAGMVLDGLDGRAARWLQAESEFGKELDSLSDIVTFGVAPAFIMYHLVLRSLGWFGVVIAVLFPVCGALRLARFNIQHKRGNDFVGLPITAAGGILATMALYKDLLDAAWVVMPMAMVVLALLMVSRTRYPNLKRIGFPGSAWVVLPVLGLAVYVLFRFHSSVVNRILFVPLALYAVYGARRMWRWRHVGGTEPKQEWSKSGWK